MKGLNKHTVCEFVWIGVNFSDNFQSCIVRSESVLNLDFFFSFQIGIHNGELQGMKTSGFSWLVIDGNAQGPLVQKSSSTNYTFSDVDREKVRHIFFPIFCFHNLRMI